MKLRKIKRNKRGSIIDIGFLLIAILGLALFILIVGYVFPQITSQVKTSEIGTNADSVKALDSSDNIILRFDGIFLAIYIGIAISVLITSFFIDSSPILIPVYIIGLGIMIIFAVVAENVYENFAENGTLLAVAASHTITNYIMSHLILITIGLGVLSMILIFAKPNRGGPY